MPHSCRRLPFLLLAPVLVAAALPLSARTFTFRVRHLHSIGSCQGRLIIGENDLRYETGNREHARIWTYLQLKRVDSRKPRKLTFLTFEDSSVPLPFRGDRAFNFELIDGEVTDDVFNFLLERVGRREGPPPPSRPPGGRYEIAVKHLHLFGGCQGTLRITPDFVEYISSHARDARLWKYLDIKRVKSGGAFQLQIHTYEDQFWLFGRDRVFKFELKEPLEPVVLKFVLQRLQR